MPGPGQAQNWFKEKTSGSRLQCPSHADTIVIMNRIDEPTLASFQATPSVQRLARCRVRSVPGSLSPGGSTPGDRPSQEPKPSKPARPHMKTCKPTRLNWLLLSIACALPGLVVPSRADTVTWNGGAGDLLWSTPLNWDYQRGPRPILDFVVFGNAERRRPTRREQSTTWWIASVTIEQFVLYRRYHQRVSYDTDSIRA